MYSSYADTNNNNQYTDYPSLVRLLTTNITPEARANVLSQLTQMNNHLLNQKQYQNQNLNQNQNLGLNQTQFDLSRPTSLNYRKKDAVELVHPSMEQNPRHMNTMPRQDFNSRPIAQNNYQQPNLSNKHISSSKSVTIKKDFEPKSVVRNSLEFEPELDIDDILNDINGGDNSEESELDLKLKQLAGLKQKIVNDSRRRKKEREPNSVGRTNK